MFAAELGHVGAVDDYGSMLDEFGSVCWLWCGRAALRGLPISFLRSFAKQVEQFFSGSGNAAVVFLIGRALKGNIDIEKKLLFGWQSEFDSFGLKLSPSVPLKSTLLVLQSTHGRFLQNVCM